ncbi:transposase [Xanthomonas hortorum]|uniref:transposase n=1 Tax=Xanthomonas hortorum TaxID=56454 RepID=UPI00159450B1|nr:hypothetical protein [Xanthomonas hortorum]
MVEQSMQPGVSVAQLARENNINDNLLFHLWRLSHLGLLRCAYSCSCHVARDARC